MFGERKRLQCNIEKAFLGINTKGYEEYKEGILSPVLGIKEGQESWRTTKNWSDN